MKIVLTISDETKDGSVSVAVEGEHTRPSKAKRVFDIILPALAPEFKPVRSYLAKRKACGIQGVRS